MTRKHKPADRQVLADLTVVWRLFLAHTVSQNEQRSRTYELLVWQYQTGESPGKRKSDEMARRDGLGPVPLCRWGPSSNNALPSIHRIMVVSQLNMYLWLLWSQPQNPAFDVCWICAAPSDKTGNLAVRPSVRTFVPRLGPGSGALLVALATRRARLGANHFGLAFYRRESWATLHGSFAGGASARQL